LAATPRNRDDQLSFPRSLKEPPDDIKALCSEIRNFCPPESEAVPTYFMRSCVVKPGMPMAWTSVENGKILGRLR
jgi:hypothetical protein